MDAPLSIELYWLVSDEALWTRLAIFLAAGVFLFLFTTWVEQSWSLPVASCLIVAWFFLAAAGFG